MINQLFWDFDGTLFDTYPKMVAAFMQALSDLGIDDVEIDEHQIYETMRQHDVRALRKRHCESSIVNTRQKWLRTPCRFPG